MTVKELIEALAKYPPDMLVRYADYEMGDCDIDNVCTSEEWHKHIRVKFDGDHYVRLG